MAGRPLRRERLERKALNNSYHIDEYRESLKGPPASDPEARQVISLLEDAYKKAHAAVYGTEEEQKQAIFWLIQASFFRGRALGMAGKHSDLSEMDKRALRRCSHDHDLTELSKDAR
jgi:hypothetical protein